MEAAFQAPVPRPEPQLQGTCCHGQVSSVITSTVLPEKPAAPALLWDLAWILSQTRAEVSVVKLTTERNNWCVQNDCCSDTGGFLKA